MITVPDPSPRDIQEITGVDERDAKRIARTITDTPKGGTWEFEDWFLQWEKDHPLKLRYKH